jgi:hypothetical protein
MIAVGNRIAELSQFRLLGRLKAPFLSPLAGQSSVKSGG